MENKHFAAFISTKFNFLFYLLLPLLLLIMDNECGRRCMNFFLASEVRHVFYFKDAHFLLNLQCVSDEYCE